MLRILQLQNCQQPFPYETTILVETTIQLRNYNYDYSEHRCDESLSKVVAEDPTQVRVYIIQDNIYAEYYDDGEFYIDYLIC